MRREECDVIGRVVLVDDGHRPRAAVLADAATWLEANGVDAVAAEDALADRGNLLERAWWSDVEGAYCSAPNDDNAWQEPRPVTVVHAQMHNDHVLGMP